MTSTLPAGDQGFLKHLNRAAMLDALRREGGLSRAELAARTGRTKVTVGSVVQDLLAEGWVHEGDLQQGTVGRPGRQLHLDGRHHVLFGAEVGVLGTRAVACTLTGQVLARAATTTPTGDPDSAAADLARLVRTLAEHPDVHGREVLGLGVAVPGPVAPDGASLLYAPNLGWPQLAFLDTLAPHLHAAGLTSLGRVRVLDNEANAAAFGEAYLPPGPSPAEPPGLLAYLSLGTGVGAGLVEGGRRVLRGAHGLAGELGHTVIQPGGLYCHCGNRGCVETLLGGWAIRASLGLNALEPLEAALLPRRREAAVQVTLGRAGEALGLLLVNLHHTLNPSDIVIGGALARLGGPLMDTALDFFTAHLARRRGQSPPVRVDVRPDSLYLPARGAAAQVLGRAIAAPGLAP
ncbi:putative NBD/HSP70 family sugar kinase [Deinococcus metalli]|uniref:Putative NBD/HSP70 family sugar kinase n=1 Tax=Deinococcus metalli TaxID=1141878 RepID=A0A7W8KJ21_9DEIO|nr:ROK family transcriptional regulator [Deinococcus metalli]MBB5377459.1 putative NBD/HSP70 family sugar kinase [Deinococcus metalli]GHF50581.1 xylose repressor [Deinococcus metalli]